MNRDWSRRFGAALAAAGLAAATLVVLGSAPAGAVAAFDEASFRTAWANPAATSIDLTADITLTCAGGASPATRTGVGALTLDGGGHTIRQTCATASVLSESGSVSDSLANVTITGGQATGGSTGGGIKTHGPLTLTNVTVTGNASTNTGGGVSALAPLGSVTLANSTVSNNAASFGGGGMETAGTATITNSTINGNTSGAGGAGVSAVGGVTMTGSTVSANTATAGGGGIAAPSVTATNSTISGNGAGVAGGGGITTATATLTYVTIAQNSSPNGANVIAASLTSYASVIALPSGSGLNCTVTSPTSHGFNFSDDTSCGLAAPTDRQSGNPAIGTLANNGGATLTRLPDPGSPLIDAVQLASCQADGAAGISIDQRGIVRPQGPGCDIGAVEVLAPTLTVAPEFTG